MGRDVHHDDKSNTVCATFELQALLDLKEDAGRVIRR
jgi:hypothetical protein